MSKSWSWSSLHWEDAFPSFHHTGNCPKIFFLYINLISDTNTFFRRGRGNEFLDNMGVRVLIYHVLYCYSITCYIFNNSICVRKIQLCLCHLPVRGPITRCHTALSTPLSPSTGSSISNPIISMMIIVFKENVTPKPNAHRAKFVIFQYTLPLVPNAVENEDIHILISNYEYYF